jgi:hypothetical protein
MTSALSQLQEWYFYRCDGDWEHSYGLSVSTLDNPGWCLCIDLDDTELADVAFSEVTENYDDDREWLICVKHGTKFRGDGGPHQLERLIHIFLTWAKINQSQKAEQPAS